MKDLFPFLALSSLLSAGAALAAPLTPEAFRDAAYAGDRATVDAALREQHQIDVAAHSAEWRQRILFTTFTNLHPVIDSFTTDWLADDPASAYALTARGWYLFTRGNAVRGERMPHDIYPAAMDQFRQDHQTAMALFRKAAVLQPDLIAASDGILKTGRTTGSKADVKAELARIMQIAPFPGSIRRAAEALVPHWGGSIPEMLETCETYAPLVTDPPGFDTEICAIYIIYESDLWDRRIKQAAALVLAENHHPWLDSYHLRDVLQNGSPAEVIAALRPAEESPGWALSTYEAKLLDEAEFALSGAAGFPTYPRLKAAQARERVALRAQADLAPLNGAVLRAYINALAQSAETPAERALIDQGDLHRRLKQQLTAMPYDADSWGFMAAQWLDNTLTGLENAAAFQQNALAYSNHSLQFLSDVLNAQFRSLQFPEEAVLLGFTVESLTDDPARTDRVLYCPFIRNIRLMEAQCSAAGKGWNDCVQGQFSPADIPQLMAKAANPQACEHERNAPIQSLYYKPLSVDEAFGRL
ncbi:hypothetical protein [Pseudorhodobacter sp. E13]|uniref:hypothetical protein n=1 Tax=Pseudorhodobacter sp. E13 TaxID=2487931 RepID=UPI000F8DD4CD|nr:hypothetical protein [Pseudorhodobacter sp. E13]